MYQFNTNTVVVESEDKVQSVLWFLCMDGIETGRKRAVLCWALLNLAQMLSFCLTVSVKA